VPTQTGLRFFIDSLLKVRGLTAREKDDIRERINAATPDDVVQRASRLLADLTNHAAVILAPDPDQQRLERVEFVPLRDGKLIAILVTTEGRIENRLVVDEIDPRRLERIHNYLNELLKGMTLDEVRERVIRELGEDKNRYDDAVAHALRLGHAVFVSPPDRHVEIVVTGQANLVEGPHVEADRVRDLLRTLEDKEALLRLLDRTRHADRLQVFLGAETQAAALSSSSVVAVSYGPEELALGALAVIGPMRMNYGKVMSVVDFTADTVSQLLAELGG
jgi:heat-inducible transcriptional repressor